MNNKRLTLAPPGATEVVLCPAAGGPIIVAIPQPGDDFIYAGKLWAHNAAVSAKLQRRAYCEINGAVTADMKESALAVLAIARRYDVLLDELKRGPL